MTSPNIRVQLRFDLFDQSTFQCMCNCLTTNYLYNLHAKGFWSMLADCATQLPGLRLCQCTLDVLLPPTAEALGHVTCLDVCDADIGQASHLELIYQVEPVRPALASFLDHSYSITGSMSVATVIFA